eukprot:1160262-Pelagomonas_calceolata.AAC.4
MGVHLHWVTNQQHGGLPASSPVKQPLLRHWVVLAQPACQRTHSTMFEICKQKSRAIKAQQGLKARHGLMPFATPCMMVEALGVAICAKRPVNELWFVFDLSIGLCRSFPSLPFPSLSFPWLPVYSILFYSHPLLPFP